MAHSPERPEQYVCANCKAVHAGAVVETLEGGGHDYESPSECGACGSTTFVDIKMWPHEDEQV